MAHFALLWKARTVEKYRLNYENEKINSIITAGLNLPRKTLYQIWSHYRYDVQKRLSRTFQRWYNNDSQTNLFSNSKMEMNVNFFLNSAIGFLGGLLLTYLCFLFFVYQLSISLYHATIMSCVIGILLTFGLAFSYRIRCLVFLLVPQFFSRVGRYTLTCYALVLILTGPATNTLKNSEVLSESMVCSQEQMKASVLQLNEVIKVPYTLVKDSIKLMMDKMKRISTEMIRTVVKINRLVLSIVGVIKSTFSWLKSIAHDCHRKFGTPYQHCVTSLRTGVHKCGDIYGYNFSWLSDVDYVAAAACARVKSFSTFCGIAENVDDSILATIKKKLKNFSGRIRSMLYVEVHVHHSYTFFSNSSGGSGQLASGIVTEIRSKADPIFTWLSWSSCITSLSLLLIIFRAKHYQHMYETRSRFDNRYVTKELRDLDLKRQRDGRETILPLNRRERAKYITPTSFRLLASEKVYLNRSAIFMVITTFKLLIHMVADYSLYWVLMTIRLHGRSQTPLQAEISENDQLTSGSGFVARFIRSILNTLKIPLSSSVASSISCLPNPYPPDFRRYTQIGVLIFLLWFFALLEPYGLRLRNVIMCHYRPERSKARAVWLYNHILRTRGSFMKFARRKLHKEYKYSSESKFTLRQWINDHLYFHSLRSILGVASEAPHCLLCGTIEYPCSVDTELVRCESKDCSGIYCHRCFSDMGQLCTICLSPTDYGDLSDVSLEGGSDDESEKSNDDCDKDPEDNDEPNVSNSAAYNEEFESDDDYKYPRQRKNQRNWNLFTRRDNRENIPLLPYSNHKLNKEATITNAQTVHKHNTLKFTKGSDGMRQLNIAILTFFKNIDSDTCLHLITKEFLTNKNIERLTANNLNKSNNITMKCSLSFKTNVSGSSHVSKYYCRGEQMEMYESWTIKNGNTYTQLQIDIQSLILIYPITYLPQSNFYVIKKSQHSWSIVKTRERTELAKTLRRSCKKIIRCKKQYREKERNFKMNINIKSHTSRTLCSSEHLCNLMRNFCIRKKEPDKKVNQISLDGDTKKKNKRGKTKENKMDKSKNKRDNTKIMDLSIDNSFNSNRKVNTIRLKYWNTIKFCPCADLFKFDKRIQSQEKNNYKCRKKRNVLDCNEEVPLEFKTKKDIEDARKCRVSTYFADQEWFKRKYDTKPFPRKRKTNLDYSNRKTVDNQKYQISSEKVTKSTSIISMLKLNTNLDIPNTEGYLCAQGSSCHCLDRDSISPTVPVKTELKRKTVTVKALERFRKRISRNPYSSSPSQFLDRIVSPVDVARGGANEEDCTNTSISRRMNYCRSLGINEFENIASDEQGAMEKPTCVKKNVKKSRFEDNGRVPKREMRCKTSGISDNTVSSQTDESFRKKSGTDGGCTRKLVHMKRAMSEKFVDIKMKKRLSVMKEFCSSLFGTPTNDSKTCKADKIKNKKPKETVNIGVNALPTMKSFSCQHIETKLLRDHTTQIGTYVIETGEAMAEKYTREAAVDTAHHTCTCATQRYVTNRDVGTWLDQQRCGHQMHYHHVFNERDQCNDRQPDLTHEKTTSVDNDIYSSTPKNGPYKENNNDKNIDISGSSLDSLSFTSVTSIVSDGTKTDTTICSLATVDYNERKSRNRRNKVQVVTKANQSTLTDKAKLCDVSTVTDDWWSPLIERKDKEISLEKKQGGYRIRNEKMRKRLKNRGMTTDGKVVTFRSQAQIIPTGTTDIMSPSRYLLESQKYYNELFSSKFYAPHIFPVTKVQKYHELSHKNRSPTSSRHRSRRGHKTKRLEKGYSPRKQKQV